MLTMCSAKYQHGRKQFLKQAVGHDHTVIEKAKHADAEDSSFSSIDTVIKNISLKTQIN